jgi:two-component system cell cycle response regulator CtrA
MSEAALRERIDYLEAEVDRLNRLLGATASDEQIELVRSNFGVTRGLARILLVLATSTAKVVTREALLNGYCGEKLDQPDIQTMDVMVCKLRPALKPHGITIETVWGTGYRLAPDMRAKIEALLV